MFENLALSSHAFLSLYFLAQNLRTQGLLCFVLPSITSTSQITKESLVCYTNYMFICTIKQNKIKQKTHLDLL